jgi:hypothetical protein
VVVMGLAKVVGPESCCVHHRQNDRDHDDVRDQHDRVSLVSVAHESASVAHDRVSLAHVSGGSVNAVRESVCESFRLRANESGRESGRGNDLHGCDHDGHVQRRSNQQCSQGNREC